MSSAESPSSPAEYLRAARALEARWTESGTRVLRLAALASFTADFVRPFLVVEADRLGVSLRPWFAPFGQFEQVVLDPASSLWSETTDAIWLALRLEDVDPKLLEEFPEMDPAQRVERVSRVGQRLVDLARALRERTSATILVSNFAPPPTLDAFDANDPDGLVHVVNAENRVVARALAEIPGAHVFDWSGLSAHVGGRSFGDPKLWYMARSPLAAPTQPVLARQLARSVRMALVPAAKCIVVDLDNTLWGGIVGDDGPEALQLGDNHPGSIFKDFQRALLQLKRRGFLLAIASKNDRETIDTVLRTHPEMVLRASDFAAIFANWEPKAVNLRRIAEELNIGLDSLVFLDDNPVERAQIRAELPTVAVPELPLDPMGYVPALRDLTAVDRGRLLREDRERSSMYAADTTRRELARGAPDLQTFLASLEMKATVGRCSPVVLERVHQLIQKTNQFNLTTRRHGINEVSRLAGAADSAVAWLRLGDRFGDMGLVCVGIIRAVDGTTWEIDTFLMSCRVMGRNVEDAFLAYLFELATAKGARRIRGVFRRTAKNKPGESFYATHGFQEVTKSNDELVYERDAVSAPYPWPTVIARSSETSEVSS